MLNICAEWNLPMQRLAVLSWPLPARIEMGSTRPAIYVSHVLGHEGAGSLHELLSEKGWVRSLSAGPQVCVYIYVYLCTFIP
jgi:secreted Zn-dependent insulinase-like peptidase